MALLACVHVVDMLLHHAGCWKEVHLFIGPCRNQHAGAPEGVMRLIMRGCCLACMQAKRKRANMGGVKLVVAGCVAAQEGEALLRRVPELDLVMGPHHANRCAHAPHTPWNGRAPPSRAGAGAALLSAGRGTICSAACPCALIAGGQEQTCWARVLCRIVEAGLPEPRYFDRPCFV